MKLIYLFILSLTFTTQSFAGDSYLNEISKESEFHAFAKDPGGTIRTGEVIKFLIDNRNYPKAKVYYINGNYCERGECPVSWVGLHYDFATHKLPSFHIEKREFEDSVYYQNDLDKKKFIAGRVQTFEVENEGKREIVFGVWFFERDIINEGSIQFAVEQIRKTLKLPNAKIAFVSYSTGQTVDTVRNWFTQNNIAVYKVEDIIKNIQVLPLNAGEAWGYLRFNPQNPDDLEPTDIPVFEELPLDLGVVAGTISTAFQDVGSHVNLKAKERGTPNVVVRKADEIEKIKALDGKAVYLSVNTDTYKIEASSDATVMAKYNEKLNRPWKNASVDFEGELLSYDKMCRGKKPGECLKLAARYGGKASNLGFVAHEKVIGEGSEARAKFSYRLSPYGFGIPFHYYKEFVEYNFTLNPEFKKDLDLLINSEVGEAGLHPLPIAEKKALAEKIRTHFLNGKFPTGMYENIEKKILELKAEINAAYPGEDLNKLKIRSSANVEDIPGFNGAGLHDSYSASIKKSNLESANVACSIVPDKDNGPDSETKMDVEPHSLGCAIKGVYASLWNLRAIRERSYQRFHHKTAVMGLAVLPAYKFRKQGNIDITGNAVVITRALNTTTFYGYQMSSQRGDVLVTNPPPGTHAELATLAFQLRTEPAISILRHAKPKVDEPELTEPVFAEDTMRKITYITRKIEEAYCEANLNYFPGRPCVQVSNSAKKPRAIDLEVKVFNNGEILFKQFRQFTGR